MAHGSEAEIQLLKLTEEANVRFREFLSVRNMINEKYSKGEFSPALSTLYIEKLNELITADNKAYLFWTTKIKKN